MNLRFFHRTQLKWGALFLFSYLFFLLALMPASVVVTRLPLPKSLQLNAVQGTLWQGEVGEVRWQQHTLHHVSWQIEWSRLLVGMPALHLTLNDPQFLSGETTVGWRGDLFVEDLSLHVPVSMISSLIPMPVPIGLTGNASLSIRQLQINPQHCTQLQGSLTWQAGNLSTPLGDIVLGSPQASLACDGDAFTAEVTQDSDMLSSQSTVNMTLQGHYQLQSTLTAGQKLPENIRSSLNFIGKDIGNGVYKVNEQGTL